MAISSLRSSIARLERRTPSACERVARLAIERARVLIPRICADLDATAAIDACADRMASLIRAGRENELASDAEFAALAERAWMISPNFGRDFPGE